MNIIKYEYAKTAVKKKRGNFMYEKFIDELRNNPASNYSIQDAEQLADKVLDISGYTGKVGAIPIIKIANNFGFATYKAKNIPVIFQEIFLWVEIQRRTIIMIKL